MLGVNGVGIAQGTTASNQACRADGDAPLNEDGRPLPPAYRRPVAGAGTSTHPVRAPRSTPSAR